MAGYPSAEQWSFAGATVRALMSPRRTELLLPAGNLDKLKLALLYGADAVYAGSPDMSLRTTSGFSIEDLREGVAYAHSLGKRVYLTLNLITHNKDAQKLPEYIETLRSIGPDGLIVADVGVLEYVHEHAPELELHVSTQASVASWLTAKSFQKLGANLVVLAREVSFEEVREIRERCPDLRLETFVHGAMCMTYSGRCLLSNYMAERGANQGSCAHSCRWKYQLLVKTADGSTGTIEIDDSNMKEFEFFLKEEFRPDELYPIVEDERGSYILNSRDLNLMPRLADYLALGIDSLKVEGRSKSEYYLAVVARAYRAAIDAYYEDPAGFDPAPYLAELWTVPSRGYTTGFHSGRLDKSAHDYDVGTSLSAFEFAGIVREYQGEDLIVEVKNRLLPGDVLEFLPPGSLDVVRLRVYDFVDADSGEVKDRATAGEHRAIRISGRALADQDQATLRTCLPVGTVVRKARPLSEADQMALGTAQQAAQQALIAPDDLVKPSTRPLRPADRASGRPPRLGASGCCGLGCNGCLPFWQDERYAPLRARLALRGAPGKLSKLALPPQKDSFQPRPLSVDAGSGTRL
jgi:U32 family peptidase